MGGGAFAIEGRDVELGEICGDVPVATTCVPAPQSVPVTIDEVLFLKIGPSDEMPSVIGGQIDAIGLVVGGDDHTAAIKDAVLAQVLFIDAQHVRRSGRVGLHVIVKTEAVDIAEIARFVHA